MFPLCSKEYEVNQVHLLPSSQQQDQLRDLLDTYELRAKWRRGKNKNKIAQLIMKEQQHTSYNILSFYS